MNEQKLHINALPARTFRWLHMNDAEVALPGAASGIPVQTELPDALKEAPADPEGFASVRSGAGEELDRFLTLAGTAAPHYTLGPGIHSWEDALRLRYHYPAQAEGSPARANALQLTLGAGSDLTMVMDFSSEEDAFGAAAVQLKARLMPGAVLRLVQVIRVGQHFTLIDDIGAVLADGAKLELLQLFLGGAAVYPACRVLLSGNDSSFAADAAYTLDGSRRLDLNYIADQHGRRTKSDMHLSGTLKDHAVKLFRGTIDFPRGCAGSTGDEREDVLLMDDTVVNQTIPLILCAEEDVAGNHGATIGRLDESLLFYAQARGIAPEAVCEMMARARIDAVVRKIPDRKLRHELYVMRKEEEPV